MSMTAEERANAWQEKWESSDYLTDEAFADLILTLHAHANAALERASSRIKLHRVIEGERDDIREMVETVRDQFAAAIRALKEG